MANPYSAVLKLTFIFVVIVSGNFSYFNLLICGQPYSIFGLAFEKSQTMIWIKSLSLVTFV